MRGMTAQDLKNSILQWAIQGKLVEQRVEEGTAKELIEQIKAEKEQLIKDKKIKKEKPLPEITEDEIPFDIPESWEWVRLGDLGSLQTGNTPSKSHPEYFGEFLPFISPGDISNGTIQYNNQGLSEAGMSYGRLAKENSIMQVCIGGSIGKSAINERVVAFNQQINVITPFYINLKYLYYFMISDYFYKNIRGKATGTATPIINKTAWSELIIPIAPLEEQKRIVAKIEELMPYVEQYDQAYTKLEVFNKKFPEDMQKSILQYAIQGKLVEQRTKEGTAEELYQQIKEEKERLIKEKKIKKEKPLPEITEEEIPFDIPESWRWVRLREVSKNIHYGYTASACEYGNSKLLRITDIQNNKVDWVSVPFCEVTEVEYQKYGLNNRDIMIARTGGTIGKSYIVDQLSERAVFASYLIRVIPVDVINEKFLKLFMETPLYWKQLIAYSMGTGQPNVNGVSLSMLILPLPPIEEQKRIVESVEKYLPYCQQLIK
ncbi:MAG: restriction endonuclease subunit S [Cellulosilyticaceae bacterium]